jgi:uncharacterized protein (TIGR03083 family)
VETNSVRLRRAFTEGTELVVGLAELVADPQWSSPAVGQWTVRELFVHAARAGSTIIAYAGEPSERSLFSAAEYYVAVLEREGIHEAVVERARVQAAELDEPIPEYLRRIFAEAEQTLQRTPAGQVMGTLAGGITLEDYLPTRIVELVVHGIDLADALGVEPDVPAAAMRVTLETLAELAVCRPGTLDPVDVVKAMTGRGTLPEGTNLLG